MHKTTFDIYMEPDWPNDNEYFHVDDLIALPIQILNRKRYFTEACCSGHPFDNPPYVTKQLYEFHGANDIKTAKNTIKVNPGSYIAFRFGVTLPSLPPGFTKDEFNDRHLVIRKSLEMKFRENGAPLFTPIEGEYNFFRANTEMMEQLYQWTLDLPDFVY